MAFRLAKIYGPLGFVKPKRSRPLRIQNILIVSQELKKVELKPAKKLEFKFDPFHENVTSIRDFMFYMSGEKYRSTNPSCAFKTEICSDRSDPTVTVTLAENDRQVLFKTGNLSAVELLQLFNKYISSTYVKEEKPEIKLTKSMSKAAKIRK
ncbi:mitochondrial ribosomal protein L53 [Chamberlinius hualienensis]